MYKYFFYLSAKFKIKCKTNDVFCNVSSSLLLYFIG